MSFDNFQIEVKYGDTYRSTCFQDLRRQLPD